MPALTDTVPPPAPPSLFRTARASESLLLGLKNDGPPARQYFDAQKIFESQQSNSLFKLTSTSLPALEAKRAKKRDSIDSQGQASSKTSKESKEERDELLSEYRSERSGLEESLEPSQTLPPKSEGTASETTPERQPRPGKYYDLLMKHHNKRLDKDRKEEELVEKDRRENAANLAQKRRLQAEARAMRDDSDTDSQEEAFEGDFGELTAYDGVMKVDLEVLVMGAPKQKKKKKEKKPKKEKQYKEIVLPNGEIGYETDSAYTPGGSSTSSSYFSSSSSSSSSQRSSQRSGARRRRGFSSLSSEAALSSTKSAESTPRLDLAAELQALQEELGSEDSSDSDGLPDGVGEKENPWDNPHMKWTLGIGGTVFFVPDAERYGHAPSLPPPPPKSLLGSGKVRVKPRLPLDISNHRYRDEHPNVWLPDPYNPSRDDRKTFEQKLMTLDFYASCSRSLTRLPPLERDKDKLKHEVGFGQLVEQDTKHSFAWKLYLEKERRRKEKEQKKLAAAAAKAGAVGDASTELDEQSASQTLLDPSTMLDPSSLEAGPSMVSAGSIGMPSEVGGPGYAPG